MATIEEVLPQAGRFERIGAHTHVKGLGLDEKLNANKVKDGIVGREKAREAAAYRKNDQRRQTQRQPLLP